jgi:hypothetical protein
MWFGLALDRRKRTFVGERVGDHGLRLTVSGLLDGGWRCP